MFEIGRTYLTLGNEFVTIVSMSNEGRGYETVCGDDGVHRFNQRDFGRVTGTDHNNPDPRNLRTLA